MAKVLAPWLPEKELLSMTLGERIRYVRRNFEGKRGPMSADDFGNLVGVATRGAVIAWEKGRHQPQPENAAAIAGLTPYRASLFRRSPEAEVAAISLLRAIEEKVDEALTGIANVLDLLDGDHGQSDVGAPGGSRP